MARTARERIPKVSQRTINCSCQHTVVNVDELARRRDLDDVGLVVRSEQAESGPAAHVVHEDLLLGTGLSVLLVGGDVELVSSGNGDLSVSPIGPAQASRSAHISVVSHETRSDLGTLGVEGNGDRSSHERRGGLSGVVNDRLVVLVGTVREVHSHCP